MQSYQPYAPKTYRWEPEPVGFIVLNLGGKDRTIIGGPFDAFRPAAIGMCLDDKSINVEQADVKLTIKDFSVPTFLETDAALVQLAAQMDARPDAPIYVGCRAGKGRTGLILAILAKAAGQTDPIKWVRANYSERAVETASQEDFVTEFDTSLFIKVLSAKPTTQEGIVSRVFRFFLPPRL